MKFNYISYFFVTTLRIYYDLTQTILMIKINNNFDYSDLGRTGSHEIQCAMSVKSRGFFPVKKIPFDRVFAANRNSLR